MNGGMVVFLCAGLRFGLPAEQVREVLPLPSLWRREGMPPHVAGFFRLGDAVLPVLDLAHLLGLREAGAVDGAEEGGLYRHLLLLASGPALLVDRALDLAAGGEALDDPAPPDWQNGCMTARLLLGGEPVALLDSSRLLDAHEAARLAALTADAERRARGWGEAGVDAG